MANSLNGTLVRHAKTAWEKARAVIGGGRCHDRNDDATINDNNESGESAVFLTKWIYPLAACLLFPLLGVFGTMLVSVSTEAMKMPRYSFDATNSDRRQGIPSPDSLYDQTFSSRAMEKSCPRSIVSFLEMTCPALKQHDDDDDDHGDNIEFHHWNPSSLDGPDSNFLDDTCRREDFFTVDPAENWRGSAVRTTKDDKTDVVDEGDISSERAKDQQVNLTDDEISLKIPQSRRETFHSTTHGIQSMTNSTLPDPSTADSLCFPSSYSKPLYPNTTPNDTTHPPSPKSLFRVNTNPKYLEVHAHITIHCQIAASSSYSALESVQQYQWMVSLNSLARDGYKGFSIRQVLEVECDASPREEAGCARSLHCHGEMRHFVCLSHARFSVRYDVLLERLEEENRRHHHHPLGHGSVRKSMYFLLHKKQFSRESMAIDENIAGSSRFNDSYMVADWSSLVAEVPTEDETASRLNTTYTIHLEDGMLLEEPETHVEQCYVRNQSIAESFEECRHSQSQTDSTWDKLLYGCFSGMVSGLGVFAVILLGDFLQSKIGGWTPCRMGCSIGTSASCTPPDVIPDRSAAVAGPSVRPVASVNESTPDEIEFNYYDNRLIRVTTIDAPESPRYDELSVSQVNANDTQQVDESSALLSICPQQRQASIRKVGYARRFGLDPQNSRTPRRSNQSCRQSALGDISKDSAFDVNNVSQTNTAHNESARPSPEERCDCAVFTSPQFDHHMPAPLPHSNTFSQYENTQPGEDDSDMTQTNNTDTSDVSEIQVKHDESHSPPHIIRIRDVSPFSNPPPFPPYKMSPITDLQELATLNQENEDESEQVENHEASPVIHRQCEAGQFDQLEQNKTTTACEESKNESLKDDSDNATHETAFLAHLENTTRNSPDCSDTTVPFDDSPAMTELHMGHGDFAAMTEGDQGTLPTSHGKKENSPSTKDLESSSVQLVVATMTTGDLPPTSNAQVPSITDLESVSVPDAPNVKTSPPNKTRLRTSLRLRKGIPSQSPTSTVAATVANFANSRRKCNVPLTTDRPQPVRCGTAGQSKKFAASSPNDATDEAYFESNAQFERIGQKVAMDLNGVTFFGTITDYDRKDSQEIWEVQFDDGNKKYYNREEITEALMKYKIHEKEDTHHNSSIDVDYDASATLQSQQSSESHSFDDLSNKKAKEKKRVRVERRLLRTAKKPAIHKPSSALVPLSRDIEKPVWQYS